MRTEAARALGRLVAGPSGRWGPGPLGWGWGGLVGGCCAAAACGAAWAPAHSDAEPGGAEPRRGEGLEAWLRRRGARIDDVAVEPDRHGGLGVTAREAFRGTGLGVVYAPVRSTLDASFPASSVISGATILKDSKWGHIYRRFVDRGELDERLLVMAFLVTELKRGEASPWQPYIASLPREFNTPFFFSPEEMKGLRGTTLYTAVDGKRRQLKAQEETVRKVVAAVFQASGEPAPDVHFQDVLWAFNVFWSRCLELGEGGGRGAAEVIVPGLDFVNHSSAAPNARWGVEKDFSVWGYLTRDETRGEREATVHLRSIRGVDSGGEVTIDYGSDKPNEELLFHYGFVDPDNAHNDRLMVFIPVGNPDDMDMVMHARMALLHSKDLSPRVFLPASALSGNGEVKAFPPEVLETLEVLVMKPEELLHHLEELENTRRQPRFGDAKKPSFAALTLLVHLLQTEVYNLEGPQGSGSLEKDKKLLLRHLMASSGSDPHGFAGEPLTVNAYNALVYRLGQKKIARGHLQLAEKLLSARLAAR